MPIFLRSKFSTLIIINLFKMNIYGKSNSCNNNLETLHKKKEVFH